MKPLWENYFNKKNVDSPVIHALQSVPVFNELTPKQFKEISRLIHKRNYKKGEIIFKKGSLGEGMYLILSGSVVIKDPESGIVFASLTNDNFFGRHRRLWGFAPPLPHKPPPRSIVSSASGANARRAKARQKFRGGANARQPVFFTPKNFRRFTAIYRGRPGRG